MQNVVTANGFMNGFSISALQRRAAAAKAGKLKGWVLWEVLLGVILVLVLVGAIVYNFPEMRESTKRASARHELQQLQSLAVAYSGFRKDGTLPSLEDLKVGVSAADAIDGVDHRPLLEEQSSLLDPWGNEYQINSTGRTIWSTGGDEGYGDDSTNPLWVTF